jgi:hypothetical protein
VLATPETSFSWLHLFAIIGSLISLSLAAILLSRRFKQDENWRPIHRVALLLALLMLASSILFFLRGFSPELPLYSRLYDLGINFDQVHILFIGTVIGLLWLFLVVVRLQFIVFRNITK